MPEALDVAPPQPARRLLRAALSRRCPATTVRYTWLSIEEAVVVHDLIRHPDEFLQGRRRSWKTSPSTAHASGSSRDAARRNRRVFAVARLIKWSHESGGSPAASMRRNTLYASVLDP